MGLPKRNCIRIVRTGSQRIIKGGQWPVIQAAILFNAVAGLGLFYLGDAGQGTLQRRQKSNQKDYDDSGVGPNWKKAK